MSIGGRQFVGAVACFPIVLASGDAIAPSTGAGKGKFAALAIGVAPKFLSALSGHIHRKRNRRMAVGIAAGAIIGFALDRLRPRLDPASGRGESHRPTAGRRRRRPTDDGPQPLPQPNPVPNDHGYHGRSPRSASLGPDCLTAKPVSAVTRSADGGTCAGGT